MKNISKICLGLLVISVFALAGCGLKKAANTENSKQANSTENSDKSAVDAVKNKLYDMVTTGAGVKCMINDPKAGQMMMFAKGDKAKVEGFAFMPMSAAFSNPTESPAPTEEEKGTMINDGTWAYMWSGKEGMKFNIKEMESLAPESQGQTNSQSSASDWKDWVKNIDESGAKYDCSPAVLSDSDFAPPSDVKFDDWGEMMKGFIKMGEEMKNKVPDQMPSLPAGQ